MSALCDFLRGAADGDLLPWAAQQEAAANFDQSLAEIEACALAAELLPARYQRNRAMLTIAQQRHLFGSHVAVIGCGGLGGYALEELARLGVGQLTAVDPDIFEEHNLNRQLLSTPDNLGQSKAVAARERIAAINPAVTVTAVPQAFSPENGEQLLHAADLVIDCLDSVETRLALERTCEGLKLPLIHGAIAGWYGQVQTVMPGDQALQQLYAHNPQGKGIERNLGNPSFTPAVVASLQVAEACKVLLSQGTPLRKRMLMLDLFDMEFHELSI